MAQEPLLVAILGPTGSGKTALSIRLAGRFHGEVVNCDSVAMYREFVIGTAKPTASEQALVPHHLIGVVDPNSYTTAGEYARQARSVIKEIARRGNLPIVVGGTGLYLRALLDGLFAGPERSHELRERLRKSAEQRGSGHLHRILCRLDREAAARIHANDIPKLIRAIEVCLAARLPMSEQWQQGREPLVGFQILRIGLDPPRMELYARINQRVISMFERGLVEEGRQLLQAYGESAYPFSAIGYRELKQLLSGEMSLQAAIPAIQQAHRNYAKRQMTWFRRERDVQWMRSFGEDTKVQEQVEAAVAGAISAKSRSKVE